MQMVLNRHRVQPKVGQILIDRDKGTYTYQYKPEEAKVNPEAILKTLEGTDLIKRTEENGLVKIVSNSYSIVADIAHTVSGDGYDPNRSHLSMLNIIY